MFIRRTQTRNRISGESYVTGDLAHSQELLGHKNRDMTEHYVRERIGQRVRPLR